MSKQPSVTIVLSIYKPNIGQLQNQLYSLNAQTYCNIEILIRNDNPIEPIDESFFRKCISRYSIDFLPSDRNVGYIKSFEALTLAAKGELIAYCDQDDIWNVDKIEKSVDYLIKENALLVATDMSLIDERDHEIESSYRHFKHTADVMWKMGDDITAKALFRCYASGLTILVDAQSAKKCIPFSSGCGHDQWLIACISYIGKCANLDETTVKWRRTGNNTSGNMWKSITSKESYREKWALPALTVTKDFIKKYPDFPGADEVLKFAIARVEGNILGIWRGRNLSPTAAKGEILISLVPNWLIRGYAERRTKKYKNSNTER